MDFRTLLCIVGLASGDKDIALAARLCEETGAHLSVLVAALAAPPPIGDYASVVSEAWLEERQADLRGLEKRTKAVSAYLAERGIRGDVSNVYAEIGRADESIGRRARYADLTVFGPELLAGETLRDKALEGALFSSGKPLLLVPEGAAATLAPKRVLVAWDARLEAARALRESLPLLIAADEVRLTLVAPVPGENEHGEEPGADAAAFLARHGAKVTIDRLPQENRSVAGILQRHATDIAADLIVMGAYGHSRLRERIFGGVTRSMLEGASVPLFMAH